jgi:hypothetical protein
VAASERSPARERALDELYAASPEEFVLVRSRLGAALRRSGDLAAADEIRGRRRPNLAAWAINQLARVAGAEIAELVHTTNALAAAQATLTPGAAIDAWREQARQRQRHVDRLADAGVTVLRGRAPKPDAYRDAIAATLDATTVDPAWTDDLVAGRLTRALSPPAGFGPAPPTRPAARRARQPDAAARAAARRAVTDSRRQAQRHADIATSAAAEQASAELQAQAADTHLQEVRRALERARDSARAAATAARAARQRADEARRDADQAAARLRQAEARLHD